MEHAQITMCMTHPQPPSELQRSSFTTEQLVLLLVYSWRGVCKTKLEISWSFWLVQGTSQFYWSPKMSKLLVNDRDRLVTRDRWVFSSNIFSVFSFHGACGAFNFSTLGSQWTHCLLLAKLLLDNSGDYMALITGVYSTKMKQFKSINVHLALSSLWA